MSRRNPVIDYLSLYEGKSKGWCTKPMPAVLLPDLYSFSATGLPVTLTSCNAEATMGVFDNKCCKGTFYFKTYFSNVINKQHQYSVSVRWNGNSGAGTTNYRSYQRSYVVAIKGKPDLECSSDPAFRGDVSKYTPEDMLVASLAGCHMLWYLHLCADAGIIVVEYLDRAKGTMVETPDGGGFFTEVTLSPEVTVAERSMVLRATELHKKANELCFIARSVKFPVYHLPSIVVKPE